MSRNLSGVYSLPPVYEAEPGETIYADQHNTPLLDIEADLNAARPISAGGTGATTADGALTELGGGTAGIEVFKDATISDIRDTLDLGEAGFANLTAAIAATIDVAVQSFSTLGYTTAGDGGGGRYRALSSAPGIVKSWHVQTGGTRWWILDTNSDVSYRCFGGVGNWVADDTAEIQAAVDYAFQIKSGRIKATYDGYPLVSSTIIIGNGSSSVYATINGGGLVYSGGNVGHTGSDGYIKWAGSIGGTVVRVRGPIQGSHIAVKLTGDSIAAIGLDVVALVDGTVEATVFGCTSRGIRFTTDPVSGYASTPYPLGCIRNKIIRPFVNIPDVAGTPTGIEVTGSAESNSSWNNFFFEPLVYLPASQPAIAYLLGVCDSNTFHNPLAFKQGGGSPPAASAGQYGVYFLYGIANYFPSSNLFNMPDIGWGIDPTRQWVNSGTVVSGSQPNKITNLSALNRGVYPNHIENLEVDLPKRVHYLALPNRAAALGALYLLHTCQTEGMYTVNLTFLLKTPATAGNIFPKITWETIDAVTASKFLTTFDMVTAGSCQMFAVPIKVRAGGRIWIDAPYSGVTGSPVWDFFDTITRDA